MKSTIWEDLHITIVTGDEKGVSPEYEDERDNVIAAFQKLLDQTLPAGSEIRIRGDSETVILN